MLNSGLNTDRVGETLLKIQENGLYQVTFRYHSENAIKVVLESDDLYEKMLDENDNLKAFTKIPGTDIFELQLHDLPADAFCFYNFKVDDKVIFAENASKTYCLQLPNAIIPPLFTLQSSPDIPGSITQNTVSDVNNTFVERDIWLYKPEGFNPANGKVLFVLDGESFMKTLTPYLDSLSQDKDNPFVNTAIVFVDSKVTCSKHYGGHPPPDRVREFYFQRDKFSAFLTEQVIPEYVKELQITNFNNVILAGHSLAAYPVIQSAKEKPQTLGGVILLSAALNQNMSTDLPKEPPSQLKKLPIYMQIGNLETGIPPKCSQDPNNKDKFRDMKNQSRLAANQDFHEFLKKNHYAVPQKLRVYSSGHGALHAVVGLKKGLKFIHENHTPRVQVMVKQYQSYVDQQKQAKQHSKSEQKVESVGLLEPKALSRTKPKD